MLLENVLNKKYTHIQKTPNGRITVYSKEEAILLNQYSSSCSQTPSQMGLKCNCFWTKM